MTPTLRLLWKAQAAAPDQPPMPPLVDATYEAGDTRFAHRLHWCAVNGYFPRWREGRWVEAGLTGRGRVWIVPDWTWAWMEKGEVWFGIPGIFRLLRTRGVYRTSQYRAYRALLLISDEDVK